MLTPASNQNLQLETSELRAELRVLRSTQTASTTVESEAEPLAELRPKFLEFGKSFTVLAELWVDQAAFGRLYPVAIQDSDPWSCHRYDNGVSKQDAVASEIYAHVPQEFHKLIHLSPYFSSAVRVTPSTLSNSLQLTGLQFLEGMGDMRAYIVEKLRRHIILVLSIDGLPKEVSKTSYDRSEVPQLLQLLQSSNAPAASFATYPRILYKDYDTKKALFESQAIVNVSLRACYPECTY